MSGPVNRKPAASRFGPAYQGGLEAALAVGICMGLGMWADSRFETSPALLFVGLFIGFGAFALRLWRLLKELSVQSGKDNGAGD